METLKLARTIRGWSQRQLARKASLSFKGLQLLERPGHNARISSLEKVAAALGLARGGIAKIIAQFFAQHPDSVQAISFLILDDGVSSWKIHLFNFVDAFRAARDTSLVKAPPTDMLDARTRCLIASTVERLCTELGLTWPRWCAAIGPLAEPWFVAGLENLKAMALVESPAEFRKRNIFVLGNFLDRT